MDIVQDAKTALVTNVFSAGDQPRDMTASIPTPASTTTTMQAVAAGVDDSPNGGPDAAAFTGREREAALAEARAQNFATTQSQNYEDQLQQGEATMLQTLAEAETAPVTTTAEAATKAHDAAAAIQRAAQEEAEKRAQERQQAQQELAQQGQEQRDQLQQQAHEAEAQLQQQSQSEALAKVVGKRAADLLSANGVGSLEAAKAAPPEQLLAIDGIGDATIEKIRAA